MCSAPSMHGIKYGCKGESMPKPDQLCISMQKQCQTCYECNHSAVFDYMMYKEYMHTHHANHTKRVCLLTCSSGLVSALSNPDWPIRRAAADAIKALAIVLGPDLDSPSQSPLNSGVQSVSCRAAEALEKCRFDKVRPVREVVQEAQAVLLDLQVICASAYKALHCHLHYGNSMLASKLPLTKLQASIKGLAVGLCMAIMHIFCSAILHVLLHVWQC